MQKLNLESIHTNSKSCFSFSSYISPQEVPESLQGSSFGFYLELISANKNNLCAFTCSCVSLENLDSRAINVGYCSNISCPNSWQWPGAPLRVLGASDPFPLTSAFLDGVTRPQRPRQRGWFTAQGICPLAGSLHICLGRSPCCHMYLGDTVGDLLCWVFYSLLVSWSFLNKPRGVFFIRNCLYIPCVALLFRLRETALQQDLCFRHPRLSLYTGWSHNSLHESLTLVTLEAIVFL